jgi:hypothetical protein
LRRRRIENITGRKNALDPPQHWPRLLYQIERESGWLHSHTGLDQQGIAQLAAQSRQRVADSRLRPTEPFCRPGYVALDHQNFEYNQQVEVKAA